MIIKTDITPDETQSEIQEPATKLVDESQLPHRRKPCLAVKAISQYKKMGADIGADEFNQIHVAMENEVFYHDIENGDADRSIIEQASLLDIAFRYFYSGGESGVINDDAFLLALRAQRQSMKTVDFFRSCRRNKRKDKFQLEKYQEEMERREDHRPFRY